MLSNPIFSYGSKVSSSVHLRAMDFLRRENGPFLSVNHILPMRGSKPTSRLIWTGFVFFEILFIYIWQNFWWHDGFELAKIFGKSIISLKRSCPITVDYGSILKQSSASIRSHKKTASTIEKRQYVLHFFKWFISKSDEAHHAWKSSATIKHRETWHL